MKPHTYNYPNDTFRGYVEYPSMIGFGNDHLDVPVMMRINCKQVRKNKLKAMEDARKMLLKIRHKNKTTV